MIPKKGFLIIEQYFIAFCENAKPGKRTILYVCVKGRRFLTKIHVHPAGDYYGNYLAHVYIYVNKIKILLE